MLTLVAAAAASLRSSAATAAVATASSAAVAHAVSSPPGLPSDELPASALLSLLMPPFLDALRSTYQSTRALVAVGCGGVVAAGALLVKLLGW
jgi:cell division protein FtsW (lipid II flippase)